MIRAKDKLYVQAIKNLVTGKQQVTSSEIENVVQQVNKEVNYITYYTAQQVINILQFCGLITIRTHLGQPRHGNIVNSGRLHTITFLQ